MKSSLIILFAFILVFQSCRKDPDEDFDTTSNVYLNVVHKFGGNPLGNNDTLMDGSGHAFYLNLQELKMYISGLKLDGTEIDGQALLTSNDGLYLIGEVNTGNYNQIELGVGLDQTLNSADPATFESAHPMSIQQGMYWVWATKYRFFKVEGYADVDGDGTFSDGVLFHIGTNDLYRVLNFSKNVVVQNGEDVIIDVEVDWYGFFNNLDLSTENNTHTTSDLPLATKVADNSVNVVSIE